MNNNFHTFLLIAVIASITAILRYLPFVIFKNKTPKIISYLANVLTPAIIGMLVVYCYKSTDIFEFPYGIPELISGCVVVILHLWKSNSLLSIGGGTAVYMLLIQLVF